MMAKRATGKKAAPDPALWELRLCVAGQTARWLRAFANLKKICEEHLAGRYRIEVINLLENSRLAQGDPILAIATLVRKFRNRCGKSLATFPTPKGCWWDWTSGQEPEGRATMPRFQRATAAFRAIQNIKAVCEEHLKGRYHLEIVDVYPQPKLAWCGIRASAQGRRIRHV